MEEVNNRQVSVADQSGVQMLGAAHNQFVNRVLLNAKAISLELYGLQCALEEVEAHIASKLEMLTGDPPIVSASPPGLTIRFGHETDWPAVYRFFRGLHCYRGEDYTFFVCWDVRRVY